MASTTTRLMTVEEFDKLPEPQAYSHELRKGVLVKVARPVFRHTRAQKRLVRLLEDAACNTEVAFVEVPFRPLPEYEVRAADVAYAPQERWLKVNPSGYFLGVPDLIVEILSPSNRTGEMLEKEQICLENGCREFWIVDLDRRQVKISTPDGRTAVYKAGQSIPLFFASGKHLDVDAIFA